MFARTMLAIGCALSVASAHAQSAAVDYSLMAKKYTQVDKAGFREALGRAESTPAMQGRAIHLGDGNHGVVEMPFEVAGPKDGAFRLNVVYTTGAGLGTGQVFLHKVPVQFDNLGDGFTYRFFAQHVRVAGSIAEDMDAKLNGYKKSLSKYDDLNVDLTKEPDGTWGLAAKMSYGSGVKMQAVADRMEFLLERSLWMVHEIRNNMGAVKDEFMKKKLARLSKADFELLANGVDRYAMPKPDGTDGSWTWAQGSSEDDKRSIQVDNFGDHMVMLVRGPSPSAAGREKVVESLKTWLASEKPKRAESASVEVYNGVPWVKAVFKFDGLANKEILERYDNFNAEFSRDFIKNATAVVKKFGGVGAAAVSAGGAASVAAANDFMNGKVNKPSRADFEKALDGIASLVDDDLDVPGGSYTFGVGADDEKRSLHVENHSDKLVLETRAEGWTAANRDQLIEKLTAWIATQKPKGASSAVMDGKTRTSPWLHVEYSYAGLTYRELSELYDSFKSTFSKEFVKQSRKLSK